MSTNEAWNAIEYLLNDEISEEIRELKKDLAKEITNNLGIKTFKEQVENYLVNDGTVSDLIGDKIKESLLWKEWLNVITPQLKELREKISKANDKKSLEDLKIDIFKKMWRVDQSSTQTQESSTTTSDDSNTSTDDERSSSNWNSETSSEKVEESTVVWKTEVENKNTSWSAESQDSKQSENSLDAYTNIHIPEWNVQKARDYISNWWTFYSPSKWTVTWGKGKYKHVCSTGSFNVLWKMWLPKVSNSTECDLQWKVLPKMGLKYIWEVDPDNLEKSWYKPQNGDTAVWPKFKNWSKTTQHQATFINWHWVSDTIQNKMSCYNSKNEPMVKVYRYTWWENLA